MSVRLGMASSVTSDIIMRIAGLVTVGSGRRYGDWRHGPASIANDVIMRIAGLVAAGLHRLQRCSSLWPPYVIGPAVIILPCGFHLLSSSSSVFFSSPNLSGRRLDIYHTSTHGVALVRI